MYRLLVNKHLAISYWLKAKGKKLKKEVKHLVLSPFTDKFL